MNIPIKNDPLMLIATAFERLYTGKEYEAWWDKHFTDGNEKVYGLTIFPDDGTMPQIILNLEIFDTENSYEKAAEIFAHELAHIAAGEAIGHGDEWEAAFEAIHQEYGRIAEEICSDSERNEAGK